MLTFYLLSEMHVVDSTYGNLSFLLPKSTDAKNYACNGARNTRCTQTFNKQKKILIFHSQQT